MSSLKRRLRIFRPTTMSSLKQAENIRPTSSRKSMQRIFRPTTVSTQVENP